MANIVDYIDWRGDVDFSISPFNEVDNIILCQISYLNFDGILESDFNRNGITLRELSERFVSSADFDIRSDLGAMLNKGTAALLPKLGESERFGSLRVSGYVSKIDNEAEEQFCAVTYTCDKGAASPWNVTVYRGTDDTIVGWKEDFNLGFMDIVPAQRDALIYAQSAMTALKGNFILCGHSKGGNLALYAAANLPEKLQRRLEAVYNNDGPGFPEDFFRRPQYLAIRNREHSFMPENSIVGMLFSHAEGFVTVESDGIGIMQHDPFTWHVQARNFVRLPDLNDQSKFIGKTVNEWFDELDREQKRQFVETVFGILEKTNATTNSELAENWMDNIMIMLKAMTHLDSKTREASWKTIQLLLKNAWENKDEFRRHR